jgi:hypothetical protein
MEHELLTPLFSLIAQNGLTALPLPASLGVKMNSDVVLKEKDPASGLFTGRTITVRITYIFKAGTYDLPETIDFVDFRVLTQDTE